MGLLQLYISLRDKVLVESTISKTRVGLPPFFQGDTVSLELCFLQPNPNGGYSAPYSKLNLSGYSCRVGIGVAPVGSTSVSPAALATSFTASDANVFSGNLALNTAGINTMLGTASSTTGYFEIELGFGGLYETVYQSAITLKAELIETGSTVPTPTDSYLTAVESAALFVSKVMGLGEAIYMPNAAGNFATKMWTDSDGTFRAERVAWPL